MCNLCNQLIKNVTKTMDDSKVFLFPDGNSKNSSIDPALLLALQNGGGFGNNGYWIWILFMWMMWGYGGMGMNGFGGFGGQGMLANQLNNDANVNLLMQAINGRADTLGQLAQITNTNIDTVRNAVSQLQTAVQMSGLQTINSQQLGDASISRQICECCCENRLAIANQTNALQSQAAQNYASQQLQSCEYNGEQRLATERQTNQLLSSNQVNTTAILGAIKDQSIMINDKFCDLEKRELQNKINTQGDMITQLRGQISNDHQTAQFTNAFNAITERLTRIESHQPNTVSVQYPNLVAVNTTPFSNGCGYNNGCGCGNNWNGPFWS